MSEVYSSRTRRPRRLDTGVTTLPLYLWICDKCKMEVDLLRSFDEHRKEPQSSELGAAALCGAEPVHVWRKVILPPNIAFGEGWSPDGHGMKGRH